mmetsp:Transcript_8596/g.31803  ORF Transcript_8596/g.31803 Transcript_8596/m.31803 type:complete len:103 (+) Transcript_8596:2291-2599(+)
MFAIHKHVWCIFFFAWNSLKYAIVPFSCDLISSNIITLDSGSPSMYPPAIPQLNYTDLHMILNWTYTSEYLLPNLSINAIQLNHIQTSHRISGQHQTVVDLY